MKLCPRSAGLPGFAAPLLISILFSSSTPAVAQPLVLFEELERPAVREQVGLLWSADGRFAYATGSGAIDLYQVGDEDELLYLGSEFDRNSGLGSDSALDATDALLSADDRHLYLISRRQVVIFDRDPASGLLRNRRQFFAGSGLGTAALSEDGSLLLVLDRQGERLLSFRRDETSGNLTQLGAWPTQDAPLDIEISGPLAAVSGSGELELYWLMDGFLETAGTWIPNLEDMQALQRVGDQVYIAHSAGIMVISLYPSLSLFQDLRVGPDGSSPLGAIDHLAAARDGSSVYGATEDGLVVLDRDPRRGLLSPVQAVPVTGRRPFRGWPLSVSASGSTVVTFGEVSTRFDRDLADGRLSGAAALGNLALLGANPRLWLTPDDRDLYVATNLDVRVLSGLRRSSADGRLRSIEGQAPLPGFINAGACSPDGLFCYAVGPETILAYRRLSTGELVEIERYQAFDEQIDYNQYGLPGASQLELSPDGRHLYVFTRADVGDGFSDPGAIAVLARRDDGRLTPVELTGGPRVFNQFLGQISQDGRWVYSFGESDGGFPGSFAEPVLYVWSRDPASGALELIQLEEDFIRREVSSMVLSPDGRFLLVHGNGLLIYRLDPSTGVASLHRDYVDVLPDGFDLGRVFQLTFDPRGDRFYSRDGADLVVFSWDLEAGEPALLATIASNLGSGLAKVGVSANGSRVYLLGGNGLSVYRRPCEAKTDRQCLRQERFQIDVDWRDFRDRRGRGRTVDLPSPDSALLWFFERDNWEMLVKVLEGCGRNDHFWLFAAATTNVEYDLRLTDTWTGESRHYMNRLGVSAPAITDTFALDSCQATPAIGMAAPAVLDSHPKAPAKVACDDDPDVLCLRNGRFRATVSWRNFSGGTGRSHVVPADADDSGVLWFFERDNWEMLVKVLDGCGRNGHFWLFTAATTTVEYELRVLDTWTGVEKIYRNPLGNAASAVTDTSAFATCDAAPPGS